MTNIQKVNPIARANSTRACSDCPDLAVYMEKSWPSQEGDPIITKDACSWVTPLAKPTFCLPILKESYEKLALPL